MSVRIGIDATPLSSQLTGIGRYTLELCRELDSLLPEVQFFLYSRAPISCRLPSGRWVSRRVKGISSHLPSSYSWLKVGSRQLLEGDNITLFWGTRTILPQPSNAYATLATVHDFNYLLYPDTMPSITKWVHRLWFRKDVLRADAVVCNSQATADKLKSIIGRQADAVARPGVSPLLDSPSPEVVNAILDEQQIRAPYFLAVGTLEPRKNLLSLLQAFLDLKQSGKLSEYQLLLVGPEGWSNRKLRKLLRQAQLYGVRWVGFVPDRVLAALYAGATAFVFPSLYEGFGIPAQEAHACGARVLASDIPELREAAGDHAIYIAPTREGIREGLLEASNSRTTSHSNLNADGWNTAATIMADIIKRLG